MINFKFNLVFLLLASYTDIGQPDGEKIWRSINTNRTKLSDDGKWLVYALMLVEATVNSSYKSSRS